MARVCGAFFKSAHINSFSPKNQNYPQCFGKTSYPIPVIHNATISKGEETFCVEIYCATFNCHYEFLKSFFMDIKSVRFTPTQSIQLNIFLFLYEDICIPTCEPKNKKNRK